MSFFKLLLKELKSIFTNQAIILTVIGGGIMYSFLYPQPYLNQVITKQKIILINLDNSPFSKRFASLVDASSGVKITKQGYTIEEAKKSIFKGEVAGYLLIPDNFYKDILLHKSPTVSFGADGAFFLIYGTIAESIFGVIKDLEKQIKLDYQKSNKKIATIDSGEPPIHFESVPLFNSNVGYINYVLPAVFILILHQLMAIGAGILGAKQNELKNGYWQEASPIKLILAKFILFFIIYLPLTLYYLGFCIESYGVPHIANYKEMLTLTCILIFSATSLGIFLGVILPRQELVTFVVLVSSLPLFFSAGFVWPTFSIHPLLHLLVQWIPITPAIMAFLKLNQLGADILFIKSEILQMVSLGGLYFLLSWVILRRKNESGAQAPL